MEAEITSNNNSKRSRKPLADRTNLTRTSSTKSNVSSFEKTPTLSSSLRKLHNTKSNAGSTRNTAVSKSTALPLPFSSTAPPQSSSLPGVASDGIFEPQSVYSRRQSAADKRNKSKGKAMAVPVSFAPAPNTEFDWDKMNEGGVTRPSKSCILHHKKVGKSLQSVLFSLAQALFSPLLSKSLLVLQPEILNNAGHCLMKMRRTMRCHKILLSSRELTLLRSMHLNCQRQRLIQAMSWTDSILGEVYTN